MGKSKNKPGSHQRVRINPITQKEETISGTKAGKKRMKTSIGDPLRTHDLRGHVNKNKK
jgi:hypothetical protein